MQTFTIESSFNTFGPLSYLKKYYSTVGEENEALIQFLISSYKRIGRQEIVLEFGGGPTIYPLISAAPYVNKIHFADFLESNLYQIKLWKNSSPDAFDWTKFVKRNLQIEDNSKVTQESTEQRQILIKKKLKNLTLRCVSAQSSRDQISKILQYP